MCDLATAISAAVSALAALGALWFAFQTVREARATRREDRFQRMATLVVELGHSMWRGAQGSQQDLRSLVPLLQQQLGAMLGADAASMKACERLTLLRRAEIETGLSLDKIDKNTRDALDEIAARLPG